MERHLNLCPDVNDRFATTKDLRKSKEAHLGSRVGTRTESHAWIQTDNLLTSSRLVVCPRRYNGQPWVMRAGS